MADYNSTHTGAQIDAGIDKINSFSHTPAEIDTSITKFDTIESTPTAIDNAVEYLSILEADVRPSEIREAYDYVDALNVEPTDVNTAVERIGEITPSSTNINNAVNILTNNSALAEQILTADGAGGVVWHGIARLYDYQINIQHGGPSDREIISFSLLSTKYNITTWDDVKTELSVYANIYKLYSCIGEIIDGGTHYKIVGFYINNGNMAAVSVENGAYTTHILDISQNYSFFYQSRIVW